MGRSFSILYGYIVVDMQKMGQDSAKFTQVVLCGRAMGYVNNIFNQEYLLCSGDNTAFESLVRLLTILVFRGFQVLK